MSFADLPIFSALTQRLSWLGQRQNVLAQNVANADTPDYRPSDLAEPDFRALLSETTDHLGVERTNAHHLAPASGSATAFGLVADDAGEVNAVGNGVDLEQQLFKVADTASRFQLASALYRKHVDMLRIALGRGAGG
jgi:flagellar basal-body rod protein FlgB